MIQSAITSLIFTTIVFLTSAQLIPSSYDTLGVSHEIIFDGGVSYYGSSIQRDLSSKFIRGGFITDEIKNNSLAKHGAINRIGGVVNSEIEYRNFKSRIFKNRDWGYTIKAGYNIFAGAIYSKDLFNLAFYGNEPFMGETMDLSGTNVSMMSFQKIGFGLISAKSKSNISFNVYNIDNRFKTDLRTLEIRQDTEGDQVEVEMSGEVEMKNNLKFNQGIGFGLDLDFTIPVNWMKDEVAFIKFEANNVGFAYMYEKQRLYSFDTTLIFSGFTFDEIIGENSIFGDSLDILDTLGIKSTEVNRTVLLPGYLQIAKIVDEHQIRKIQSFFGIRLYPTLIYSPYVFGGIHVKVAEWLGAGVSAGYGGFGKFRTGLYTNLRIKKCSLGLATENLIGLFSKKGSGQSFYLKFRCAI